MDINLLKILFSVLGFQFLFTALFLFQNKKGKSLSNKLLATVFLLISFVIVNLYLIVFRVDIGLPQLLFIDDTFMFACIVIGIILFVDTQSISQAADQINKQQIPIFSHW